MTSNIGIYGIKLSFYYTNKLNYIFYYKVFCLYVYIKNNIIINVILFLPTIISLVSLARTHPLCGYYPTQRLVIPFLLGPSHSLFFSNFKFHIFIKTQNLSYKICLKLKFKCILYIVA